ncbi:MAG: hypothetical protein HY822_04590 [Acidobacteria bacterium]|nr:hypothetical protein [Acidobacteriota bacterium]
MPNKAKLYISCVIAAGALTLVAALYQWESAGLPRFLSYLLLAILAATLKVRLPGITGTFSLSFLFVLIGVADLGFAETVAVGCAATLAQSLWHARQRPTLVQVLFNVANLAVSIAACFAVSRLALGQLRAENLPLALALAASVFFVANTVLVSGVLALLENKTFMDVWARWFLWCFPYYLAGAAIAGVVSFSSRHVNWQSALLAMPLAYLVYFHYHLYMDRQTRTAC